MRLLLAALAVSALGVLQASAGDAPDADPATALFELVRKHGGEPVTRTTVERRTTVAFDAMTYQVHTPNRIGRLQDAHPELGPRAGGVVLELDAREGPYGGPMELPQVLAGPYYATYCNEVAEGGGHWFVRARFGHAFPADVRRPILARIGMGAFGPVPAGRSGPAIPVVVEVEPERTSYAAGTPLQVTIILRNGLPVPIEFASYAQAPNAWNGETLGIQLPEVRRNGVAHDLYRARPALEPPDHVSGPATLWLPRGASRRLRLDLAKWSIDGGWTPGTYTCELRMDNIHAGERTRLSVRSAPFRLVVE